MGYVILAMVLFILTFLLVSPIKINVLYNNNDITIKLKYLFYKISLLEDEKDSEKTEETKKTEDVTKEEVLEEKTKIDFSVIQAGYKALKKVILKLSKKTKKFIKKIKMEKLRVFIRVSGETPYDIGLLHGNVNIIVYSIYSLITNIFKVKEKNTKIIINPDFISEGEHVFLQLELRVKPISIINSGLSVFVELVKAYFEFNKQMKL